MEKDLRLGLTSGAVVAEESTGRQVSGDVHSETCHTDLGSRKLATTNHTCDRAQRGQVKGKESKTMSSTSHYYECEHALRPLSTSLVG